MKVSLNWLQTYFSEPLPAPQEIEKLLTFHSCEVEEVITLAEDVVFDIKVLPDKSAWLLSHRGVAKELSVILNQPLKSDPLAEPVAWPKPATDLAVEIAPLASCDYYGAIKMSGLKVGPSPAWLKASLEAVGQRSINNLVDATNYVMLSLGQPLHAFDAKKLTTTEGGTKILVRRAKVGETITTLTGDECKLDETDTLIVDGRSDVPLALAGIKGGQVAMVDKGTTEIILESAHFERTAVRKTARRLNLLTDAARRYENGVVASLAPLGLLAAAKLITEVAQGVVVGHAQVGIIKESSQTPVEVSLSEINSLLGLALSLAEVEAIVKRFGYDYDKSANGLMVVPPFERDDLVIAPDLVEEIGRIAGLHNIVAKAPIKTVVTNKNKRYQYLALIREALLGSGFSEVYTSSFRASDIVKIQNALASDKGCLRSGLSLNLAEAKERNLPHLDLLGLSAVKIFEIGTVFAEMDETVMVGLAVQSSTEYKPKVDDQLLLQAKQAIEQKLGQAPVWLEIRPGVAEFSIDELLPKLPELAWTNKVSNTESVTIKYEPFSLYPAISRDIALWVSEQTEVAMVEKTLKDNAGPWCVRITHRDTFSKEDRTSLAFRLVFQAKTKTLTDKEINEVMGQIYQVATASNWVVR